MEKIKSKTRMKAKVATQSFLPPPTLTVSEFAEAYRILSVEDSPEPGKFKCWPFQREMLDSFNRQGNRMAVYMTSAQIGKALDINTLIATPDGWTTMGELKVGDKIFDEKGNACEVTYVSPVMLHRDCYRVTFSDDSSVVADADHLWQVGYAKWGRTDKKLTLTTEEMLPRFRSEKPGGKIRNHFSIPVAKPLELPEKELPIDPYVLGVWLGDGHNNSNKVTLNSEDLVIIDCIVNAGHRVRPIYMAEGYGGVTFSIDPGSPMRERKTCKRGHNLKEVGLNNRGYCKKCAVQSSQHYQRGYKQDDKIEFSLYEKLKENHFLKKFGGGKHIPQEYLRSSFKQRLSLLQGLMDTDGTCGKKGRCEFSTSDKELADGFFELITSLGFKAKYVVEHPFAVKNGVRTPGKPSYLFTFMAYRDDFEVFRAHRKLERQPFMAGRRVSEVKNRKIVNIEKVDSVPVRCIQVDSPSHLFLAGKSMIPTHNTTILFNMLMYMVCARTGGITFMLPSEVIARDYSKARFTPMLRDCKKLADLIPPGKTNGNTILYKQWPTGYLRFVGSGNADKLCSFPTPWLVIDELDRCEVVARNSAGVIEGNSLLLLFERMKRFAPRTFTLMTSTPSVKDTSQIYEYWLKSDQRLPYVACPHCEHEQFLDWENFFWDGKGDKHCTLSKQEMAKSFHFVCKGCAKKIWEEDFEEFPPKTRWVPQKADGEFPGFHINAFYTNSWQENFTKYLDAGQNQAKLMVWWNTTLGLPYNFEALQTPDWQGLQDKEKQYHRGTVPKQAMVLLAGCDVQHDRVEVTVAGVIKNQFFVIDHHVIPGNTHNADDQVWQDLDDLIHKSTWDKPDGTQLKIHKMSIDSRHNSNAVGRFARTRKKVVPVTGTGIWTDKVLPAKKFEIKVNGKIMRLGKHRYPLGVNLIKMDLYGRLNLKTDDGIPSEYISFPDGMSDEYYKQVCGEVCELTEDSEGRAKYKWIKKYPDVEGLDCLVYILGLHTILNMHKWSDEKWNAFEFGGDNIVEDAYPQQASFL
ncbi:MAG: phage terminase large subunit family protein [Oligoflexales bacterium]|nr:phage terminase large subunit family protein [Oligoflexales bacterium]